MPILIPPLLSKMVTVLSSDPQRQADPLADQTMADILGTWPVLPDTASAAERAAAHAEQWRRIAEYRIRVTAAMICFITRVLGYHFMAKVLMDQTRPLT